MCSFMGRPYTYTHKVQQYSHVQVMLPAAVSLLTHLEFVQVFAIAPTVYIQSSELLLIITELLPDRVTTQSQQTELADRVSRQDADCVSLLQLFYTAIIMCIIITRLTCISSVAAQLNLPIWLPVSYTYQILYLIYQQL